MIGSILVGKPPVVSVAPDASLSSILALMHEHRIGAVLVMEGAAIVGLVSERDIVRCLHTHGRAILDECARDLMSAPVETVGPHMSVCDAMGIMTDRRFRHLPVVEDGRVLGVVSIGDLVKARIEEAEAEAQELKHYIAS
ncbi:CBS domain-containing protein [Sandarakinorhabdus rubra]|uniref:CBS domain-containing protein n=1 Tax=Sandarakinorhabdus rubra TaxID=2672568 RepID=UPI0013DACE52|nr:CBS domain-containing protein [Sandarakinorhabdus rubra]